MFGNCASQDGVVNNMDMSKANDIDIPVPKHYKAGRKPELYARASSSTEPTCGEARTARKMSAAQ